MTKDFEHAWHSMLNSNFTSDLARGTDNFAIHEKRPRDDSNPWNVAWPSDSHRRLEILGDSKVVINWMSGDWEVKGNEHSSYVREVIDQFVRWYLSGFDQEMMRVAGADMYSGNRTRLLIHMRTG